MLKTALKGAAILGCAIGLAAVAPSAFAQEERGGLYLDGGYSFYRFEANDTGAEADTNALNARLGFQFGPHWAIEAELAGGIDDGDFDFDSTEDEIDFDGNNDGDFTDAINGTGNIGMDFLAAAYVRYIVPVSDRWDVSARVGYAYTQLDVNAQTLGGSTVTLFEEEEDGFTAGAGVTFDLTESLQLRADYTWFGFDEVDANAGTISVGLKF
jgi:opacity protein-like surface antigen